MSDNAAIVCIVEDDVSTGIALRRLVGSLGYEAVVFNTATDFLASDIAETVFCVLLDVNLPDMNGLKVQERLQENGSWLPIVFLTGAGDVPMSVKAMRGGAVDFLLKPVDESDLMKALAMAMSGHEDRSRNSAETAEAERKLASLTSRETDVLGCVLTGATNRQIGDHLGIAEKTVKVHRGRVMEKLGAKTIVDLIAFADICGFAVETTLKR